MVNKRNLLQPIRLRAAFLSALTVLLMSCSSDSSDGLDPGGPTDPPAATLQDLQISPTSASIAKGTQQQFSATGIFSDGTTRNMNNESLWGSTNPDVASVNQQGLATGGEIGEVSITAEFEGFTDSATLTVTDAEVVALNVTPRAVELPAGQTEQYTAIAIFSDDSTQNVSSQAAWSSSNEVVASVNEQGLVTGNAPGMADIVASFEGVSGSAPLTVTEGVLESLTIVPQQASIAKGTTRQFTAQGNFSDGQTRTLTGVSWSSSDTDTASIDQTGLARGLAIGSVTITAMLDGESDTAELTVTAAEITSIEISPDSPQVPAGKSRQMRATAVFTDDTTQDVTNEAVWNSSDTAVADVSNADGSKGFAVAKQVGSATIAASFDGTVGNTLFTVTEAVLEALSVTPDDRQIPAGFQRQYTATGRFSDNSTEDLSADVTWTSENQMVATISNAPGSEGLATGEAPGQTFLSAALDNVSDTVTVTVTDAELTSIEVSPLEASIAKGRSQQFAAIGMFDDGSTLDLTRQVNWQSSDTAVATINQTGLAESVATGTTEITAMRDGITGQATLEVTDAVVENIEVSPASASVPAGETQQFTATGSFSDGSTADITSEVVWESSDTEVATISNADGNEGKATGRGEGQAAITARSNGVSSDPAELEVTPAELVSIEIQPRDASIANGTTQQFTAEGTFTDDSSRDLTAEVTWTSSAEGVATISNADGAEGRATAKAEGSTTIRAVRGEVADQTALTVTPAEVQRIDVTPENPSIPNGTELQLTATAVFTDGSEQDVTTEADTVWSSNNDEVAVVSNADGRKGIATGRAVGTAAIVASFGGEQGSTELTVTDAVVVTLEIQPQNPALPVNFTRPLTAEATLSDGSMRDVTAEVTWISFNTDIATVSNADGQQGLATGVAAGTVTISAVFTRADGETVSGSTALTVEDSQLVAIDVTPKDETIEPGDTLQYTATGEFASGTQLDITTQVIWNSSDEDVATISNAEGSEGLATADDSVLLPSDTTITATEPQSEVSGATQLTVSPLPGAG